MACVALTLEAPGVICSSSARPEPVEAERECVSCKTVSRLRSKCVNCGGYFCGPFRYSCGDPVACVCRPCHIAAPVSPATLPPTPVPPLAQCSRCLKTVFITFDCEQCKQAVCSWCCRVYPSVVCVTCGAPPPAVTPSHFSMDAPEEHLRQTAPQTELSHYDRLLIALGKQIAEAEALPLEQCTEASRQIASPGSVSSSSSSSPVCTVCEQSVPKAEPCVGCGQPVCLKCENVCFQPDCHQRPFCTKPGCILLAEGADNTCQKCNKLEEGQLYRTDTKCESCLVLLCVTGEDKPRADIGYC